MNIKSHWQELILLAALILLTIFSLPQMSTWAMQAMFMPSFIFFFAVAFIIFGVFVWKERVGDERELEHRNFASRVGFLLGAGTLVVAIVVKAMQHMFEPWLVIALFVMIFGKAVARVYASLRK